MKPNDLHLHIHNFLVMVQWSDDQATHLLGERHALLTVSSRSDSPTTRTTDIRGESVSLNAEQRKRIIQALQGDAPPCACSVCTDGVHIKPATSR